MRVKVRVRQVAVMVRVRVSVQGMNVSQCNVLKSHENTAVCVCVSAGFVPMAG